MTVVGTVEDREGRGSAMDETRTTRAPPVETGTVGGKGALMEHESVIELLLGTLRAAEAKAARDGDDSFAADLAAELRRDVARMLN
jgi:hypothetical protein